MTRFGAGGSGSGSGSGAELGDITNVMDERLRELTINEVTRGFLDATRVLFGTVKEGTMKIKEEWLRSFRIEIPAGPVGV